VKRSLLVITLLVGVFITLGAAPAISSASNCSVGMSAMFHRSNGIDSPPWGAGTTLNFFGCTDVSGVEVAEHLPGSPDHGGWYDATLGLYPGVNLCLVLNTNCTSQNNVTLNYVASVYSATYFRPYYANVAHWVNRSAFYRLKNLSGVWGPWHFYWDAAGQAAYV
jgi:hypothetical protein